MTSASLFHAPEGPGWAGGEGQSHPSWTVEIVQIKRYTWPLPCFRVGDQRCLERFRSTAAARDAGVPSPSQKRRTTWPPTLEPAETLRQSAAHEEPDASEKGPRRLESFNGGTPPGPCRHHLIGYFRAESRSIDMIACCTGSKADLNPWPTKDALAIASAETSRPRTNGGHGARRVPSGAQRNTSAVTW